MGKDQQRRWKCPCCNVEGWSRTGGVPAHHDRIDGRSCKQFSERMRAGQATPANVTTQHLRSLRERLIPVGEYLCENRTDERARDAWSAVLFVMSSLALDAEDYTASRINAEYARSRIGGAS